MMLRPLLATADFELAASWLQRGESGEYLEVGNGHERVTPTLLGFMAQRDTHFIRLYAMSGDGR
jgi:hypothetical protein